MMSGAAYANVSLEAYRKRRRLLAHEHKKLSHQRYNIITGEIHFSIYLQAYIYPYLHLKAPTLTANLPLDLKKAVELSALLFLISIRLPMYVLLLSFMKRFFSTFCKYNTQTLRPALLVTISLPATTFFRVKLRKKSNPFMETSPSLKLIKSVS